MKYKYSLNPLSAKGSLMDPGGRFNIGTIDPTRLTAFPGLYLAFDKDTAIDELFARAKQEQLLNFEELALVQTGSITIVSVHGNLESVFDLRQKDNLVGFVDLVKNFHLSNTLIQETRRLNIDPPRLVTTVQELLDSLLETNWRLPPMQLDVPANCQIFGQVVAESGIEGIIFPSVLTKQPCLVVYPQNFAHSSSFIELDDPTPTDTVQRRLDASSFQNFI
ncbi:MAG: RES family NAD+ phosphorylase [Elusimicrobia bacterium]|nr:RES family NAD+ phosphorylase [Elusimicrobiota bacterium]